MQVKNYGDMIAQVTNKPLIAYVEFGSYQGSYIAVLDAGDSIELWRGSYGSCSGCDFLQNEQDWDTGEIDNKTAEEYVNSERLFATIPKETVLRVDEGTFVSFLPANIRDEIYEFDSGLFYREVLQGLGKTKQ